jgi:hypothetical protein
MIKGGDPAFVMEFVHGEDPRVNGSEFGDAYPFACFVNNVTIETLAGHHKQRKADPMTALPEIIRLPVGFCFAAASAAIVFKLVAFLLRTDQRNGPGHND